jgi:putative transport protein
MLESLTQLLERTPILALFVVIGLGYALGQVKIGGFSLGVGAILFAGLALGAIAPKAAPPSLVGAVGLIMFLYGIGIQYGRQFFAGLRGPGLKWNLLGAIGVLAALAATLLMCNAAGISVAQSAGLFAGAVTSTPALQAAIDAAGSRDPAIGYSVAYPFGVIGPILCLFAFSKLAKTRVTPAPEPLRPIEITLGANPPATVAELIAQLPKGVDLVTVRQHGNNLLPDPRIILAAGDGLLLMGLPEALEKAREGLGSAAPGRLTKDRSDMDMRRVFVSRAAIVGQPIALLAFPNGIAAKVAEVRRGDALLFPDAALKLEYGDRVGIIAAREALPELRSYFGDSIKSTAEFSYASVGLGMALGVLLGLVPIPIPSIGTFSLGIAGGPLIVALLLGRFNRIGPLSWYMPPAANLTLRNFGLMLFLAAVGLGSGAPFVETVSRTGFLLLGIGALVLLTTMLTIMVLGHLLFKISSDDLFGIIAGSTGNPAILAYANQTLPSDRVDVAYATVFPSMTILKIICVQVAIGLLSS